MLNNLILINEYDLKTYAENDDGKLQSSSKCISICIKRLNDDDEIMTVMNSRRVFTQTIVDKVLKALLQKDC